MNFAQKKIMQHRLEVRVLEDRHRRIVGRLSDIRAEAEHLTGKDWLLERTLERQVTLKDALKARRHVLHDEIRSRNAKLRIAEAAVCEGQPNWYRLLGSPRAKSECAEALKEIGLRLTPDDKVWDIGWTDSAQRIVVLDTIFGDPENLRRTIEAVRALLPYCMPDREGYARFMASAAQGDDAAVLRVPHDLSHAYVDDQQFASLEDAVAHVQEQYGQRPLSQPDIDVTISP